MENKELYSKFVLEENKIPIFSQPWWLDIVAGEENWNVIIVEDKSKIIASFPYYIKQDGLYKIICQPPLTQKLGTYIKYPEKIKNEAKLALENKVVKEIIDRLPKVDAINFSCDVNHQNWIQWYWKGFSQTTRYSFRIDTYSSLEDILLGFSSSARNICNKYLKGNSSITIDTNISPQDFYAICEMTFKRQDMKTPYSYSLFEKIWTETMKRGVAMPLVARGEDGKIHGVAFEVWDNRTMYDLLSGQDPNHRNAGERYLLIMEGIRAAKERGLIFDCEGSMIEPINDFYRKTGGIQTPYYRISKEISKRYRIYSSIRNLGKALLK